ncbi:Pol protein [Phytophthora palmivora]|uniref:Pol protein n=1 Tax=Phytophthora palmivora TaxID=4796 RepID=A0A2P4X4G1_9STRA|nr:Pol protein [Phytophthora palmivora]
MWLSFFAECNFRVEYKPGKLNVLDDALPRRPDYELAHASRVTTGLYVRIRLAHQGDENYTPLVRFLSEGKDAKVDRLSPRQRAQLHRYELTDGLLYYRVDPGDPPRVVVPNDEDLKYDILLQVHDAPMSGHLGREKTYRTVSQTFWWPHIYKWMTHYVKTYEACQRMKPSGHASAPLQSLPVPANCWKSRSLDSVFGLPADDKGNTKGVWDALFQLSVTELTMSTADHPRTDGQTERVNRVLEDTLRSICAEAPRSWSDELPMVAFALSNAVHTPTGFTPFYLNGLRHPQVPLTLRGGTDASIVSGGEARKAFSSQVSDIETESLLTLSAGLETQWCRPEQTKEYSAKNGRGPLSVFTVGDLVLLNTKNLQLTLFAPLGVIS